MARAAAHESFERDDVRVGSERAFGIVFAVVFAIVALWPLIGGHGIRYWALKVGLLLHHVVNPLVMGLIFLLGVVPTALIMRARGRDSMRLDAAKAAGTTWVERVPPGPAPDTMKNLF